MNNDEAPTVRTNVFVQFYIGLGIAVAGVGGIMWLAAIEGGSYSTDEKIAMIDSFLAVALVGLIVTYTSVWRMRRQSRAHGRG